jgi:hypothetical protein
MSLLSIFSRHITHSIDFLDEELLDEELLDEELLDDLLDFLDEELIDEELLDELRFFVAHLFNSFLFLLLFIAFFLFRVLIYI